MFGIPTWLIGLIGGLVVLAGIGGSEYFLYSKWKLAEANYQIQTKNVDTLKEHYNGAVNINKGLNDQIIQLKKDKEYDESLLLVQHDAILTLQRNANDRKAKAAQLPSGAASPTLICAITGVCEPSEGSSTSGNQH